MSPRWNVTDIDHMILLLSAMEEDGFEICSCPPMEVLNEDDHEVFIYVGPNYHPVVDEFVKLVHQPTCAFDTDSKAAGKLGYPFAKSTLDKNFFSAASLDHIRAYLMHCCRAERFCEGYIQEQFKSGNLLHALDRLRTLRSQITMEPSPVDALTFDPEQLLQKLYEVLAIAGIDLPNDAIKISYGHGDKLRPGHMACYIFEANGKCLKVGKVRDTSGARFNSHHYRIDPGIRSSLARSLAECDPSVPILSDVKHMTNRDRRAHIANNSLRVNYILEIDAVPGNEKRKDALFTLSLMESLIQCLLRPRFEDHDAH